MEESTLTIDLNKYEIETTDPNITRFSDLKGSKIVLYFYPKDNTPGCTHQAIDFKEKMGAFAKLETVILGVSRDSLSSHHRFKEKYQLPFELLCDQDEALCSRFDVIKTKNMFGKKVLGIERSTFLLDSKGQVLKAWRKVKVKNHVQEVLEYTEHLNSP